jgi:hypothetical protein
MSIEAMKQALECLSWIAYSDSPAPTVSFAKAAKDLRTAIAQCEARATEQAAVAEPHKKQEPVAWVGLTDDEIEEICWTEVYRRLRSFAKAIEAKLKEKNT